MLYMYSRPKHGYIAPNKLNGYTSVCHMLIIAYDNRVADMGSIMYGVFETPPPIPNLDKKWSQLQIRMQELHLFR
jgi:hypothetical protein